MAIGRRRKTLYNDVSMNSNLPVDDKKKKDDLVKVSGGPKEKMVGVDRGKQEVTPMTEYTRKVDLEPEVESWLEKLEKEDSQLQDPVMDDKGQTVLDDVNSKKKSNFKVILPLTKEEVESGLHHKVVDSVRWLSEWCVKTIKMFHGKVAYRKGK